MTRRRHQLFALIVSAGAVLAACGDDAVVGGSTTPTSEAVATQPSTTVAATPDVVLRYVTDGGCVVLGPNCPTYTVWSDGKVEIGRTHVDGPAEITGNISPDRVAQWFASVQGLDVAALAAKVGPGVCNSCVDGADIVATIELPGGPVVLDSTKLQFDPANPTFAALGTLMAEVQAVGELPIRTGN
jgi:hypothetical protein